ncbi:MAG: NUDIX domain-containing protein [Candidatus Levybacteria bacterium]|nr:NUDIX domain-containing protein [Candidatus Levybacteria bacterium]
MFNSKHELALQMRAAHDTSYPLHWDFSAAGGIDYGEDHKAAALRELKEELGIENEITFIGEDEFRSETKTDKLYLYKTIYDGPFNPDPDEVASVQIFSLEKIRKMIETGDKFHPEFLYLWRKGIIK